MHTALPKFLVRYLSTPSSLEKHGDPKIAKETLPVSGTQVHFRAPTATGRNHSDIWLERHTFLHSRVHQGLFCFFKRFLSYSVEEHQGLHVSLPWNIRQGWFACLSYNSGGAPSYWHGFRTWKELSV